MRLKLARIGNSRGVRLPAASLRRYRIGDSVVMVRPLAARPQGSNRGAGDPLPGQIGPAQAAMKRYEIRWTNLDPTGRNEAAALRRPITEMYGE